MFEMQMPTLGVPRIVTVTPTLQLLDTHWMLCSRIQDLPRPTKAQDPEQQKDESLVLDNA